MGNCLSSFRAQFFPNRHNSIEGTVIPLGPPKPPKPTEDDRIPTNVPSAGSNVISVSSVDLLVLENGDRHFTDQFDAIKPKAPMTKAKLVVRRGHPFKIKLNLNRKCDLEKDAIILVFTLKDAPNPSYSQGTVIVSPVLRPVDSDLPSNAWVSKIVQKDEKSVEIKVTPAANAIVGEWELVVDTKIRDDNNINSEALKYVCQQLIFLLFNPWCKTDSVYLENPDERKEFVLNDMGMIWRGTHNSLRPAVWNFGQYEESVLECCMYVLSSLGNLRAVDRADPVKVARHLSAVINSPDENGVVEGNWSGDYKGGTSPTQWTGSHLILQEFYKKKKPVKYGQCWVFSGVCTTVCRALGLAGRSVTNFCSAHDTHSSLTIDMFYDGDLEPIERLNIDSIWNFHVWNEVWMERPDLEPGDYGGWQAIDSTPQETSDGQFRCGPASVKAIKKGEVIKPYDTQFLFSEVNADKVYWKFQGSNKALKMINKSPDKIGQLISTKKLGSSAREDLTSSYKFEEGTEKEREIMLLALRQCRNAFSRYYLNEEFEDISFDFLLLDDIVIGSPFNVILKVKNKSKEGKKYSIEAILRVDSMLYTGELKKSVKKEKFEANISAGSEKDITMMVEYWDYEKALVDQSNFNIAAIAKVKETNFDYFSQDDFRVRMPDIKLETEGDIVEGKEFTVSASLKNPLPKLIKRGGVFTFEGPGLGAPLKIKVKNDIPPGEETSVTFKLTPLRSGERSIAAKFDSRELKDVDGMKTIFVTPSDVQPNKPL